LLGADTVIDDRARGDDSAVKDVDVVLDCVGSDEMERSFAILIAGGRFATVANRCAGTKGLCVWESLVRSRSHKAQLTQIGNLIDAGDIRVFVDSVYPLSRAKKAYARSARGKRVGEVSVRMAE
jgi:NADPH:quinone reductase-like Zn-dependent oxidoreductase